MRLPRHDTPLRLSAETPAEAIARDEALLERGEGERWWIADSPAVVVGPGLHHRLRSIVDVERCQRQGVEVLERRAGGGALLLDQSVLCGAICVPLSSVPTDVTESYRWLGDHLAARLIDLGVTGARRVAVSEARADLGQLRAAKDPLVDTCFAALSPHEVVVGQSQSRRKVVGLAQIRRRHAALFVLGILLEDQSPLAEYLVVPEGESRDQLRARLRARTIGLRELLTGRSTSEVVAAIAGARPSAP